jgi:hypothetical protein
MLKWLALILVTTVMCFGDTQSHSTSPTQREKSQSGRPMIENDSLEKSDDLLTEEDRKELRALIEELDKVNKAESHKVGEQSLEGTTTPSL